MTYDNLLKQLDVLKRRFGSTNQTLSYAYVRNNFPELAENMFSDRDLRNVNLRSADLMGLNFSRSDMAGCSFEDAQICGAQFHLANVLRSGLSRARDWLRWRKDWVPMDWSELELPYHRHVKDPEKPVFFCPWMPELWLLRPQDVPDFDELPVKERTAIEAGSLALAAEPLTFVDFAQLLDQSHLDMAADETAMRPTHAAMSYCRQMTHQGIRYGLPPDTEVQLPSFALLNALEDTLASRPPPNATGPVIDRMPEFAFRRGDEPAIVRIGDNAGSDILGTLDRPASLRPIFLLGRDDL